MTVFIGGKCPICGADFFGDIDIGTENAYLVCPNAECSQEFKLGNNNACLELQITK